MPSDSLRRISVRLTVQPCVPLRSDTVTGPAITPRTPLRRAANISSNELIPAYVALNTVRPQAITVANTTSVADTVTVFTLLFPIISILFIYITDRPCCYLPQIQCKFNRKSCQYIAHRKKQMLKIGGIIKLQNFCHKPLYLCVLLPEHKNYQS